LKKNIVFLEIGFRKKRNSQFFCGWKSFGNFEKNISNPKKISKKHFFSKKKEVSAE
jgi:hypothetical protein